MDFIQRDEEEEGEEEEEEMSASHLIPSMRVGKRPMSGISAIIPSVAAQVLCAWSVNKSDDPQN